MCHDIISSFTDCPHTINSGVIDCPKYDQNGNTHCDPKEPPTTHELPGKCINCRNDDAEQAESEMQRALEESMREHEASRPNQQQSEEDYERELRAVQELSLNEYQAPADNYEEEMARVLRDSLRDAQQQAERPRLYLRQCYKYGYCGHTVKGHLLPIERNLDDPEDLVEDEQGSCPECLGERGFAAVGRARASRAGREDEDDPVPAYDPGSLMDELTGSEAAPGFHTTSPSVTPNVPMAAVDNSSPSNLSVHEHGGPTGAALPIGATATTHDLDNARDVARAHWAQQPQPGAERGEHNDPHNRSPDDQQSAVEDDYDSGPDDADYDSDPEQNRRRSITRSTASRIYTHADNVRPRYMGDPNSELGALQEGDEEDEEEPAQRRGVAGGR